jgi:hypothetical protein
MGCHTWFFRKINKDETAVEHCYYSLKNFGENRYTDIDTPHDLFRIGTYPTNVLLSLEETLQFIENNKEIIYGFANDYEKELIQFWENNPDGVIEFG